MWAGLIAALSIPTTLLADSSSYTETRIYELPLVDFPYNNGRAPSMKQSLLISRDFYYVMHNYILDAQLGDAQIVVGQKINSWPIVLFDTASLLIPLGSTWAHEEWHRASLGAIGVGSVNHMSQLKNYGFYTDSSLSDVELGKIKTAHPQEFVRIATAGLESAYELNLEFEKQAFFNNHHPIVGSLLFQHVVGNFYYMNFCTNKGEAGGDCTMWVYEMFRPHAPVYQDTSVLTTEERDYLIRQRNLTLLNVIDPMLFGKKEFVTPSGDWHWNANARHMLTPFGYDIAANVFLKSRDDLDIFGAIHTYHNDKNTSLGLDATLPRYATRWFDKPVHITPRVFAWMQPDNLMFRDATTKLGGLASVRVDVPIEEGWEIYGELESKSKGWVAGNEYLDSKMAVRFGLTKVIQAPSRWKIAVPVAEKETLPQ
ncbi:MAG: hypothetical protein ABL885_15735 [Methylophilaceae bacterium]